MWGEHTSKSTEAQALGAERQARKLSKHLSWFVPSNRASDEAVLESKVAEVFTLGLRPTVHNGAFRLGHGVRPGIAHSAVRGNIYCLGG
jgi:hypothetical protein